MRCCEYEYCCEVEDVFGMRWLITLQTVRTLLIN